MLLRRIGFLKDNDLYICRVPLNMVDKDIRTYIKDFGYYGDYFELNDIKQKEMSEVYYKKNFMDRELRENIDKFHEYIKKYRLEDKNASWVQMKHYIAKYLYLKGLTLFRIRDIMCYTNHSSLSYLLNKYKLYDVNFKEEDFIKYIDCDLYPQRCPKTRKTKFLKQ